MEKKKTTVWIFHGINWQDCTWEDLQKGNLKRETESLLIAIQHNATRNY